MITFMHSPACVASLHELEVLLDSGTFYLLLLSWLVDDREREELKQGAGEHLLQKYAGQLFAVRSCCSSIFLWKVSASPLIQLLPFSVVLDP